MDSATIVAAALDSKQLETSINDLVSMVAKKTKEMADNFTGEVKRMEDAIKNLGSIKIDSGGTANGGSTKRAAGFEKLQKSVNDASASLQKHQNELVTLKNVLGSAQEQENSFLQAKQNAANTISKENELLQRQEQEFANLKSQQSSFVGTNQQTTASIDKQRESVANLKNEVKYWQSVVSQMQNGDKKLRFNSLWLGDTTSKQGHDILDVANKLYSIMQKLGMETEKGSASTSQAVRAAEELAKYYKISREEAEKLILSVQESPLARGKYTTHYDTRFGLDNLTMQQKTIDDFALRKELAQGKLTFETDNLTLANKRLEESEKAVASASSQRSQLDSQIAAKEKEIAETKGRIATATKEQAEAEKNASQESQVRANIQSQIATKEKIISETRQQLTTATKALADAEKQQTADGGSSRRTSKQKEEENQVKATTQAYKEQRVTLDQQAAAIRKANQVSVRTGDAGSIRNADTLQTMNIQLDLLRERLREARQQYSSFVALASHATTIGDKGLYQFATEGVHKYGDEVRTLIPQIRGLQNSIQQMGDVIAPQGHTIQNYVNSLQKANPELAALNEQFKRGKSLLQQQETEFEKNAQAQRDLNSATNQQKKTLDEVNAYIRLNIQREQERRNAILQTGFAARETANQLIKSAHEQASAQSNTPITGAKELAAAVEQMRRAYFDLSSSEKISPIGRALEEDIKRANEALTVIRKYNQSFVGSQHEERYNITNASTLDSLRQSLKGLTDQYNKLTVAQINAGKGDALIQHFQDTTRAAQILQKTLNRPVSLKAALAGDERTLDDMAYKMQRLRAYKQGIDLTKPNAANEIKQVDEALIRLQKDMDKYMSKADSVAKSNNMLGRSWNYMKNRLAFYFTVGASTQFIKNLIEVRSQYEMNERALGILVNSAERGTQIFNELSQMALVSPYTLIELSAAAKQLTAYDIAAKDVVDTTRRLADMAAAVGIPIERLTYALGQIKAYGYLNARDARMFANAGIPLVKQLSEYYTELEGRLVSTADIYDRIKKKSIGHEEVMSVIAKMTDEGGKFYDFQAKMADTLKVQLANLTLAWNNMLNAMGEESQGVLVGGINALKQMFLHWKDIEHILYELVIALGAYKAYQIITTRLMGATSAALDSQILAMKRNNAAMLEKQALTRKLTVEEARLIATKKQVTAADYMNALSGKQLTKQKALMLVALNKNNVALKSAIVNMGLLTTAEVNSITAGKAFAIVLKSIGISIRTAALAVKSFVVSMMPLLAIGAIYELYHAWDSYGEHVKEVNKQAAENAKEAFQNIKEYLQGDVTSALQDRLEKGGKVENDAAGQKAWDEMREKIELSSIASNAFIAKLMQINDINQRLSAGFKYLESVQKVAGVMQTLEEDAVKVSSTSLGGLFGEGLKDDLADFINAYQKYVSLNENLRQSGVGEEYFNAQKKALEEFRGEVEKTTTSLYNIASKEGFNTNEQREFFEREISEIAQAEQMGAKETRIFRMQAEKEYYAYARAQLVAQLEYQQGAQKAATEKRIKDLDNEFGTNKALQENFFTWLTEKQDHAVKNMLRGKTQEEIKQGEWLKGSNAKWVEEMARKFSKEYGVSFSDLHRLVLNANTWSINIPVFFQTIGQPLSDVQRDYEARTGKKFSDNPIIKDAKTQVDILDTLKKKQKEVANEMATAEKAGGQYWEDNKKRLQEQNNALVSDIHAYNALTDAEEKAQKKSGSKGSKKDALLDALKQEISLVEKLQGDYDKLEKSGASQTDALDTIRASYGKTIRLLNTQLSGFGLPQINISELITGKDPNKALAHFKQTLNTLVSKGMLTLERSKELEAVIEKFTLSAKTYNLDKITKGLNNELDRLKEEYELAVALDADPELGSMFADWMGIDMSNLPRTAQEYADKYTSYINKYLKDKKSNIKLPNLLNITDEDLRSFQEQVGEGGMTQEWVDEITKGVKAVRDVFRKEKEDTSRDWNAIIEKYGGLQAKLLKIYKDNVQQQASIVREFGTNEEQVNALDLVSKIKISQDPAEIARLQEELAKVMNDVTSRNPIALKTYQAVRNEQESQTSKAYWDDFKDSDLYSMTFTDMANNSTLAIQMIIDKLNELKDKVDEDPASMKALIKSLEDAESELLSRNPFAGIVNGINDWVNASRELQVAEDELKQANIEVAGSEIALKNAQSVGDKNAILAAEQKLARAQEKQAESQKKVVSTSNNAKKALSKLSKSMNEMANTIQDMGSLLSMVSKLLRFAGADDAADAIDAINEGFTAMVTVIMAVDAAIKLVTSTNPYLLAIAAALSIIVGLVSFLSGNSNKKITEQVEASERAVKKLELAYVDLQQAVDKAYGTAVIGAKQAALANKELQLAEIQRQIQLEKSRSGKNRDEDKIIDLQKQYKELFYEIKNGYTEIVDDLMGTDVASFAENLVSSMIDAFKQGEDYMKVFSDNFDEMIDNMIMKSIVSRVVSQYLDAVWDDLDKRINERTKEESIEYANAQNELSRIRNMNDDEIRRKIWGDVMPGEMAWLDYLMNSGEEVNPSNYIELRQKSHEWEKQQVEDYRKAAEEMEKAAKERLDAASAFTDSDIDYVMGKFGEIMPELGEKLKNILGEYYKFGESSETQLSALQQGIQGITETTAGALEAYMNGVSQQVYYQSDLLTQIRDAVVLFNTDVQVATMGQILLQLQNSYLVQTAIQNILNGWSSPNGLAVRVEMA